MNLLGHWSIETGVYVCPDCEFASPVREWHDCRDGKRLHPMDSRKRYQLVPKERAETAEERVTELLGVLRVLRSSLTSDDDRIDLIDRARSGGQ